MTVEPTMIAIIPTEEWREALLGIGPCGSAAPRLRSYRLILWGPWEAMGLPIYPRDHGDRHRWALPLLWKGKPVTDGIARAIVVGRSKGVYLFCKVPKTLIELGNRLVERGIASEVITDDS